jgi:cobalt-zinc-cadmium efflux system membrane fusion protein
MKYIGYILVLAVLVGCGSKTEETKAEQVITKTANETLVSLTKAQMQNAEIKVSKAEIKEISAVLSLNGKIDVPPQNLVSVSIPMGGYLKSTDLLPGMMVKKGQVIAVLEDQQYVRLQQDYLLAKVKLKVVEGEYFRQKELNASKAASDKVFQQAEGEYRNAKINLKALEENLELIGINPQRLDDSKISKRVTINSPITGYVAKVNANVGKYLTPSEVLFELVNAEDIHLNVTVFEKDLASLAIGQHVVAYSNANPDKKYPCDIILIGHSLSADKSTEVHCHFKKYDKSLVPGMYMNAQIELKNKNAVTIPETAIVRFENKEYVFVQHSEGNFEMLEIKSGAKESGFVEVINSEVIGNEEVVTNGAYFLLMKLKNTEEEE